MTLKRGLVAAMLAVLVLAALPLLTPGATNHCCDGTASQTSCGQAVVAAPSSERSPAPTFGVSDACAELTDLVRSQTLERPPQN